MVDIEACPELADPTRSLLGPVQEEWLRAGLAQSKARWNVIAQQTRVATLDVKPGPGRRYWTDGWDGYPAARRRLLEGLAAAKTRNPIVVGGDVHSFWVSDLAPDPEDPRSPTVAAEFVGTSITSETSCTSEQVEAVVRDNPLREARRRGPQRVPAPGARPGTRAGRPARRQRPHEGRRDARDAGVVRTAGRGRSAPERPGSGFRPTRAPRRVQSPQEATGFRGGLTLDEPRPRIGRLSLADGRAVLALLAPLVAGTTARAASVIATINPVTRRGIFYAVQVPLP